MHIKLNHVYGKAMFTYYPNKTAAKGTVKHKKWNCETFKCSGVWHLSAVPGLIILSHLRQYVQFCNCVFSFLIQAMVSRYKKIFIYGAATNTKWYMSENGISLKLGTNENESASGGWLSIGIFFALWRSRFFYFLICLPSLNNFISFSAYSSWLNRQHLTE